MSPRTYRVPEEEDKEVGLRVMKLRINKGLSQQECGNMLGIHASGLCRIEKGVSSLLLGHSPYAKKIADLFKVSIDYILTGEESSVRIVDDIKSNIDRLVEGLSSEEKANILVHLVTKLRG